MHTLVPPANITQPAILRNSTAVINQIKKSSGFTLIELLVAMAVVAIIAAGTFATFGKFNRQQNISIAFDNFQNTLAEAKSDATSSVIVKCNASVGILVGYQVVFPSASTYTIEEVCQTPGQETHIPIKTVPTPLPTGITFKSNPHSPPGIRFLILSGGANPTGSVTITNGTTAQDKTITVDSSGVIQLK